MSKLTEEAMILNRQEFLFIVNAAVDSKSLRFGRLAVQDWLRVFPGDLGVMLQLAKTFIAEGNKTEALPILEKICNKDPEFRDAQENMAILTYKDGTKQGANALGCSFSLGRNVKSSIPLPAWSQSLKSAFTAYQNNRINEAEKLVHNVIDMDAEIELAAILHIKISCIKQDREGMAQLAELYHSSWPECLVFSLCLADAKMERDEEGEAVNILHQCVANDVTGQVSSRLWGINHRYRPLWSDKLEITFEIPIPSEVTAVLGWNKLPPGELEPSLDSSSSSIEDADESETQVGDVPAPVDPKFSKFEKIPVESSAGTSPSISSPITPTEIPTADTTTPAVSVPIPGAPTRNGNNLQSVTEAFANIATRLNKPSIAHSDGRFPIYIILSTRTGLSKQYGQQSMVVIDDELKKLAETIGRRVGMGSLVFYPDDPEITSTLGITKIDDIDPMKIKMAITELDKLLMKKGNMVGALLIVGGHNVVPFHQLPNPTDDVDEKVPSDSPYGVLDANYFIPEWPVGRVPGEESPDAGLLLEQIRNIRNHHNQFVQQKSINIVQLISGFLDIFHKLFGNQAVLNTGEISPNTATPSSSLGITAAVWKRASLSVFRPVGDPGELLISPPEFSGSINADKIASSQIGYFNLHGLTDSPNWYGQRDTSDVTSTDYPVAISPKDIGKSEIGPQVIFSEACYGAYIFNKTEDESMALKFISLGAKAFVGSTTIAYGSVNTPLIGADLLGFQFWKSLRDGLTPGEAFMQAKVEMVRELNKRQGFLDGDDQKTLISFVLYGDPLGGGLEKQQKIKKIFRTVPQPASKTFGDEKDALEPRHVSEEELSEVRQIVAAYLPDLDDAHMVVNKQRLVQAADTRAAMTHLEKSESCSAAMKHVVVTIKKKVETTTFVHHHFARATLDPQGKLIKLSISR